MAPRSTEVKSVSLYKKSVSRPKSLPSKIVAISTIFDLRTDPALCSCERCLRNQRSHAHVSDDEFVTTFEVLRRTSLSLHRCHGVARKWAVGEQRILETPPARAANRIRIGDMSLSLRRARSTWLTAHLEAGTSLPVLREVAGPLAAATLDDLLGATTDVSPEQAVTEALRA